MASEIDLAMKARAHSHNLSMYCACALRAEQRSNTCIGYDSQDRLDLMDATSNDSEGKCEEGSIYKYACPQFCMRLFMTVHAHVFTLFTLFTSHNWSNINQSMR